MPTEPFEVRYPKQIRETRLELGYTQVELAELLDVSRNTVQHWEAGKAIPQPHHRKKIDRLIQLAARKAKELGEIMSQVAVLL